MISSEDFQELTDWEIDVKFNMTHAAGSLADGSNDRLNTIPLFYNVEHSGNVIISVETMMETSAETTHIKNMHIVSDVLLK